MIVFPAIDLVAGKVVRLEHGDRSRMDVYSDDPAAVAADFVERGANWVHVVDLSSAFGEDEPALKANARALRDICGVPGISVDAGGGVRSLERIDQLERLGVSRVALGTVLVRDPDLAHDAAERFSDLLVADVAGRDGAVRVDGWRSDAGVSVDDLVAHLADLGFAHLVYTDVSRDGMRCGIDAAAYGHVSQVAGFPVVASGGIASLADLEALASLGEDVIEGAITGRALYEGCFSLEDALGVFRHGGTACDEGRPHAD